MTAVIEHAPTARTRLWFRAANIARSARLQLSDVECRGAIGLAQLERADELVRLKRQLRNDISSVCRICR